MKALKRVFLTSLFFLVNVAFAFCIYPAVTFVIHSLNQGVSSGYNPAGLFWSRLYPRFIPWEYETGAANAFDLGLATLCTSGLIYGILAKRQKKEIGTVTKLAIEPTTAVGKVNRQSLQFKRRLLLIPAWFVAQYLWNMFSGMSFGQSLDMMTSINSLWISAVVITAIVLYAKNYQVVYESNATKKPSHTQKAIVPKE